MISSYHKVTNHIFDCLCGWALASNDFSSCYIIYKLWGKYPREGELFQNYKKDSCIYFRGQLWRNKCLSVDAVSVWSKDVGSNPFTTTATRWIKLTFKKSKYLLRPSSKRHLFLFLCRIIKYCALLIYSCLEYVFNIKQDCQQTNKVQCT